MMLVCAYLLAFEHYPCRKGMYDVEDSSYP